MSERCSITEQRKYVKDKLAELRSFVDGTNIAVDVAHFSRLYDLLQDSCGSIKLKPFTIQVTQNRIGVKWTYDTGYVSVLFGPGDNWEWEAHGKEDVKPTTEGGDASFDVTYSHSGECSFVLKGEPYYYLPTKVEEMISLPDDFDGMYEPLLKKHEYDIVWVTNKYDGMLSGYLWKGKKLHYFDCIEETEFKRRRMFEVYELSWLECLNVWRRYHWWHIALASEPMWKFYWWIRKFNKRPTVERHWEAKDKFKRDHNVVGYFEG
jgi:hypothetical protein